MRLGYSERETEIPIRAARQAVVLDSEHAQSHLSLGMVHYVDRNAGAAIAEIEFAIRLNPSSAMAQVMLGRVLIASGKAEKAIPHIELALRLSPQDPLIGSFYGAISRAHLCLREYEKAVEWAKMGRLHQNIQWPIPSGLASALGHLGRLSEARAAVQEMEQRQPGITIAFVREHLPVTDPDYMQHILEGLRRAGLPEG